MSEPRTPADFVRPDLSDTRVNRMWARIEAHGEQRRAWQWAVRGGLLASVVAVALVVGWQLTDRREERTNWPATGVAQTVTLSDDSTVELAPDGALSLTGVAPERLDLELRSGRAVFEVSRRPTRRFQVSAGNVVVRVVGTRFSVTRRDADVEVVVERGSVEVSSGGATERLTAGQRWSNAVAVAPTSDETEVVEPGEDEVEDVAGPVTPKPQRKRAQVKKSVAQREAPSANAPTESIEPTPAARTAADVFKLALDARRAGRVSQAATAFEDFLRAFPGDSRAPLAWFELGRLRMDSQKDAVGAVDALRRALRGGAGEFREDAQARLVRALDELGRRPDCLEAKATYLKTWPTGPYAQSVATRCGD